MALTTLIMGPVEAEYYIGRNMLQIILHSWQTENRDMWGRFQGLGITFKGPQLYLYLSVCLRI